MTALDIQAERLQMPRMMYKGKLYVLKPVLAVLSTPPSHAASASQPKTMVAVQFQAIHQPKDHDFDTCKCTIHAADVGPVSGTTVGRT